MMSIYNLLYHRVSNKPDQHTVPFEPRRSPDFFGLRLSARSPSSHRQPRSFRPSASAPESANRKVTPQIRHVKKKVQAFVVFFRPTPTCCGSNGKRPGRPGEATPPPPEFV